MCTTCSALCLLVPSAIEIKSQGAVGSRSVVVPSSLPERSLPAFS